ncbi:MAG: MBL fold metallo-hydrolase [Syntrophomonadaceae bacterium]|jgi:L-ascorbate metabolism protein UlaG (beta-lactamase superfamily)
MIISWLGHASFIIETAGKTIITDPFDERSGYTPWQQPVDIATVSHDHWDHNAVHVLQGNPKIIKEAGQFNFPQITITGFSSWHDKNHGADRGSNNIYKIMAEDISLVHLGDQGAHLETELIAQIGQVDILFTPVGGKFTLDAEDAFQVIQQLNPKIVIPMHFQTPHLSFKLAPVEAFTCRFNQVIKLPFLEVNRDKITDSLQIIVLDYTTRSS